MPFGSIVYTTREGYSFLAELRLLERTTWYAFQTISVVIGCDFIPKLLIIPFLVVNNVEIKQAKPFAPPCFHSFNTTTIWSATIVSHHLLCVCFLSSILQNDNDFSCSVQKPMIRSRLLYPEYYAIRK
jgi:hypothetical protein